MHNPVCMQNSLGKKQIKVKNNPLTSTLATFPLASLRNTPAIKHGLADARFHDICKKNSVFTHMYYQAYDATQYLQLQNTHVDGS